MKYLLATVTFLSPVIAPAQSSTPFYVHPHTYLVQRSFYLNSVADTLTLADPLGSNLIKVDSGQLVVARYGNEQWALISNYFPSRQGYTAHPLPISPTDNILTEFFAWRPALALVPYEPPAVLPKSHAKRSRKQAGSR